MDASAKIGEAVKLRRIHKYQTSGELTHVDSAHTHTQLSYVAATTMYRQCKHHIGRVFAWIRWPRHAVSHGARPSVWQSGMLCVCASSD